MYILTIIGFVVGTTLHSYIYVYIISAKPLRTVLRWNISVVLRRIYTKLSLEQLFLFFIVVHLLGDWMLQLQTPKIEPNTTFLLNNHITVYSVLVGRLLAVLLWFAGILGVSVITSLLVLRKRNIY